MGLAHTIGGSAAPNRSGCWVLYTMEGSQNGGAFPQENDPGLPAVEGGRFTSLGAYGEHTGAHWKDFTSRLDGLELGEGEKARILGGAIAAFRTFEGIMGSLYPYMESDLCYHVTAVNPEAGQPRHAPDPGRDRPGPACRGKGLEEMPLSGGAFRGPGKKIHRKRQLLAFDAHPPAPSRHPQEHLLVEPLFVAGDPRRHPGNPPGDILSLFREAGSLKTGEAADLERIFQELKAARRRMVTEDLERADA